MSVSLFGVQMVAAASPQSQEACLTPRGRLRRSGRCRSPFLAFPTFTTTARKLTLVKATSCFTKRRAVWDNGSFVPFPRIGAFRARALLRPRTAACGSPQSQSVSATIFGFQRQLNDRSGPMEDSPIFLTVVDSTRISRPRRSINRSRPFVGFLVMPGP